ncbi:hypothetical protein OKA05_29080 [Luteolibacter arcticus]|uniref:DUF3592 domain-containing protein n=1 Tax=Luteolibacter arcticus TaxID=1581411 RepID=A0ABT3GT01_9BACT|nr:hypothetical protein [Luteolibacter arcticus]MCW1926642.1 hypothetical protein [Luteolibacter arcticus]
MSPRPFHRSRLFWLGVLGSLFLIWVWWDSGAKGTMVQWGRGEKEHEVWLGDGVVGWQGTTHLDGYSAGSDLTGHRYAMLNQDEEKAVRFDFPPALSSEAETTETVRTKEVEVALWVIVVCHAVAWLGMVLWWQRRKGRVAMVPQGK